MLNLLNQPLDAALKLAAELRARDKRGQVEQVKLLVCKAGRHLSMRHAQCKALRDGGFANAGLADEAGIILCAAAKDLHHAVNFTVAADDTVDLAIRCALGQIRAVGVEILALDFFLFLIPAALCFGLLARLRRLCRNLGLFRRTVFLRFAHFAWLEIHQALHKREGPGPTRLEILVVLPAEHAAKLLAHRVEIILGNAHALHHLLDGADIHLHCAF